MLNTFTLASLLAQLFLAALSSEETCTTGTGSTKCAESMCNVWIGGQKYCSQCAADGEGPIDGICKSDKAGNTCDNKVCTSCANGYFLHKGGCYKIGGTVGLLICADTTPSDLANTAGKCTACATGYFKNPTQAAAAVPPCIACNDTTGFTDSNSAIYKGVANCAACTAPEKGASSGDKPAKCTACVDGYFDPPACGTQCHSNCKACSGGATNDKCISCNPDKPYLKKTQLTDQTGTCTTEQECTNGNKYYADDADPRTCKACAEGTFEGCETCEKSNEGAVACKTCGSQKKIRPDKKGCIDACPPDVSTEKNGVCECVEGYAPSADGSSCASSSANKSVLSTGAIAGISVAAVVVVGGLVGFLCWWFVCRGKA